VRWSLGDAKGLHPQFAGGLLGTIFAFCLAAMRSNLPIVYICVVAAAAVASRRAGISSRIAPPPTVSATAPSFPRDQHREYPASSTQLTNSLGYFISRSSLRQYSPGKLSAELANCVRIRHIRLGLLFCFGHPLWRFVVALMVDGARRL